MSYAQEKKEKAKTTWEKRKREWTLKVLMIGGSGLMGSILSTISQMNEINLSNMTLGTQLVILGWAVGTPIACGIIFFVSDRLYEKNKKEAVDIASPPNFEDIEKEGNKAPTEHTKDKMTAFWLIILTIIACSAIPALMIWSSSAPK